MEKKKNAFELTQWKEVLYIVEWPNKFKTFRELMNKWEIPKWEMWATVWHFYQIQWATDGKKVGLGVDLNTFDINYSVDPEKKALIKELEEKIKKADIVFVMTDDDYEWEVIAYSIYDYFKKYISKFRRTPFTEIEKKSINSSIENSTELYRENKMLAGRSRAALDRIIGWGYSPLVKKYGENLTNVSAGRVQSPSLDILVEREKEIWWHSSKNYFSIWAEHPEIGKWAFSMHTGSKIKDEAGKMHFTEEEKDEILEKLKNCKEATVVSYEEGKRTRNPNAPFKMSTITSEWWAILGFSADKIQKIGNQLVDLGISSYIRTDSVIYKPETIEVIRDYIAKNFDEKYQTNDVIEYQDLKSAQQWHNGISPVNIYKTVEEVRKQHSDEHAQLYELIWKRAIASQMASAQYETQKMILNIDGEEFVLKWEKCVFKWFLEVYNFNNLSEDGEFEEEKEFWFPKFNVWDKISVASIKSEEHKTKPPSRYNEASLIKFLEKQWVWRPSTYASIFKNLEDKWYVEIKTKKRVFYATDKWLATSEALKKFAKNDILDINFTSKVEDERDTFAKLSGSELKKAYLDHMSNFYEAIKKTMEEWWVSFDENWFTVFKNSSGWNWNANLELIWAKCDCSGDLGIKKTTKWDILVCSKNCGFFNFLGNNYSILDEECPVCANKTISKTVWAKWSQRQDCIKRIYNSQTKKNEGCTWKGKWL